MRRGSALAGLGLFGLGAYLIFFFDPMGRTWVSPDGTVKLEKYFDRPWRAFFGGSDFAYAGLRLVDRSGAVRFDTGLVPEGGTENDVVVLPRLFGVSRAKKGPHGISAMLVDLNGQPVRQLTREEFFFLADHGQFWMGNADEQDILDRLTEKIGLAGDRDEVEYLAGAIPYDSRAVGWEALRNRILESDDLRFPYAERVIGDFEAPEAKRFLAEYFFHRPERAAEGLDLLRSAEKIAEADRRALIQPWFSTRDAKTAIAVIGAWKEAEGAPSPALKIALGFYYGAPPDGFYNDFANPEYFLEAVYALAGPESLALHKAILFGLTHSSENFWRTAFYLVRDHKDLPIAPFAEALRALGERESGDALLVGQLQELLKRN